MITIRKKIASNGKEVKRIHRTNGDYVWEENAKEAHQIALSLVTQDLHAGGNGIIGVEEGEGMIFIHPDLEAFNALKIPNDLKLEDE